MGILFPNLPDEIGWECLLRVEFSSHNHLRCVSKSWKAALNSPQFYQERQRSKLSEQRVCLIQNIGGTGQGEFDYRVSVYDPMHDTWKRLLPMPSTVEKEGISIDPRCHSLKQKLVLMGGWHGSARLETPRVYLYDFPSLKWRRGASFPVCANYFTSAADNVGGLIYVAGGRCMYREPVSIALVYKVEENEWEVLPDMATAMGSCLSAFVDGKFYVKDLYGSTIQVFDSHTRTWKIDSHTGTIRWKTRENRWNAEAGPVVSTFGHIYFFSSLGLVDYNCSENMWKIVGFLPSEGCLQGVKWATVFGHNIFLGAWNHTSSPVLHMLVPPSGSQGVTKLIGIETPSGFQGYIAAGATLEI